MTMLKRWLLKPLPKTLEEQTAVEALSKDINVNPLLAILLWQRNIRSFEEAKAFFRPTLGQLHDPFLMKDMDCAVQRLIDAIACGEKIMIYGDYDVDGTTSVAMFYGFLKKYYEHVIFYIPDRYKEGYGVQRTGIEKAHVEGFTLIITLDCGIKSVELIAEAKALGIDFIVCDHHRPGNEIPDAAVLDPKRTDCSYPFDELTGCGVGFKLLQAYCLRQGIDQEKELFPYLDLLVTSIAADIVPIVGENRVLACFGLKQINTNPRIGLKVLMSLAAMRLPADISNVVFGLAPRINAAGRIAHAHDAVNLLLSDNEPDAIAFAEQINIHNTDRKDFDSRITIEAIEMIEASEWLLNQANSTVLYKSDWHKGVVGIVASRCIEKYYRPTIILTRSNGKVGGSARSVHGFNVYDAIEQCADLLEQFGGHFYAAGLTLDEKNVEAFRQKFDKVVTTTILPEQKSPILEVDMEIPFSIITEKFQAIVTQMNPFGPQNMMPIFMSKGVEMYGIPRVLKEKHLKIDVRQGKGQPVFSAIGFNMSHFYEKLLENKPFSMCYQVEINEFRGERNLQLQIRDIRFDD